MSPIRHRHSKADTRLPSLRLALDESYHPTVRQLPYRSNRSTAFEPYPTFYADNALSCQAVANEPSLLFATAEFDTQANGGPGVVEAQVGEAEANFFVAILKKVFGAVVGVFQALKI